MAGSVNASLVKILTQFRSPWEFGTGKTLFIGSKTSFFHTCLNSLLSEVKVYHVFEKRHSFSLDYMIMADPKKGQSESVT